MQLGLKLGTTVKFAFDDDFLRIYEDLFLEQLKILLISERSKT